MVHKLTISKIFVSLFIDIILFVTIIFITLTNNPIIKYLCYQAGLNNKGISHSIVLGWFFLILLSIVLLLILIIRTIIQIIRKLNILFAVRIFLIIFSILFSINYYWIHTEPCYFPFTEGLAQWAKDNVDVKEIKKYLNDIDIDMDKINANMYVLEESEWPEAIKELGPSGVIIHNVLDNKRKHIQVLWGGGFQRWGMVIGYLTPQDLISDLEISGEYKISFHQDGYVFCGL